ncbi:hypothetical protein WAI453_011276 [Rhynchosporium graminicola]|uniref:Tat pathway signal sequence n=1 Tax=Rhynchosporium graminicola TaxID=2792576 RepID=A0A1E1KB55_9HELO|nr:uncharacterized protein RCO7_05807 [Rhynchosporium commune]
MSFMFPVRATSGSSSMHRRDPQSAGSLPAISEDGSSFLEPRDAPPVPERAWNRPPYKNSALGTPPSLKSGGSPPPYTHFDSSKDELQAPEGDKLTQLRGRLENNKHISKRGGWKRLAIIAAIVILCLVGLIVGLAVGLRNKHNGSSSERSGSSSPNGGASGTVVAAPDSSNNATFPAGSYRFDTYLNTASANCTSNPATWRCYPYFTYATSPTQSTATFDWIISPSIGNKYTISSTQNFFSIIFNNASLSLMNAGADDEHYFFQTMMDKPTKPVAQLGSQNVASTCFFNSTTLQGSLYTKMPKTFMVNNDTSSMDTNGPFSAWPFAVKVEQVASAGSGTPTCLGPSGENLGEFSVADTTQLCDCLYLNTGT